MYRLFAIGVLLLWVSAMAALFVRDVWPAWTAQDPPPMTREQFARLHEQWQQYSICGGDDRRLGTAWSHVVASGSNTTVYGTLVVEGLSFIPPVRIETVTEFDAAGGLDSFRLDLHGPAIPTIKVHGERRGIYFPCELQFGTLHRQANLDLAASRLIGEGLRPFTFLPTLSVGQSWRMQLLDPLSAVLGGKAQFKPIVARVTGMETIEHPARSCEMVECFVVQTHPGEAQAWVDPDGRVLVQEVEMPGLGKVRVSREPCKRAGLEAAKKRIR